MFNNKTPFVLYSAFGVDYVSRSETDMDVYSLNPIWDKLRESANYNLGIDKSELVIEETLDTVKH